MDSNIINTEDLQRELRQVCELNNNPIFEMLYRGSETNFRWDKFHAKSDNKSPTLAIVKTNDGCIFGGYTQANWNSPRDGSFKWMADSEAFVFRLKTSKLDFKKYRIVKNKNAIYCRKVNGPCFGEYDLEFNSEGRVCTTLDSDILDLKASSSNFGVPFKHREFNVSELTEVEVFHVLNY